MVPTVAARGDEDNSGSSRSNSRTNSNSNSNSNDPNANNNNQNEESSSSSPASSFEYFNNYIQQRNERNKPRDVVEAAVSAFQSLLVGSIAAGTSFVGFPLAAIGASILNFINKKQQNDLTNTSVGTEAEGTTSNVSGMLLTTTLGAIAGGFVGGTSALAIGLYSIYRAGMTMKDGITSTPDTLKAWLVERQIYDPFNRCWMNRTTFSPHRQRTELLALLELQEKEAAHRRRHRQVLDTELYDRLEISSDASRSVIKKAYFAKARDIHPDKNRDDPLAHQRFIQLHEAYSILSDDEKRTSYDRMGQSSTSSSSFTQFSFDASVFVAVFFSGDGGSSSSSSSSSSSFSSTPVVENFVGELSLTSFIDNMFKIVSILKLVQDASVNDGGTDWKTTLNNGDVLNFVQEFFNEDDFNKNNIRNKMRSIEIASYLATKASSLFSSAPPTDDKTCAAGNDNDNNNRNGGESFDSCLSPEQRFRKEIYTEANQILNECNFYGQTYLRIIGASLLSEASWWKRYLLPLGLRVTYSKWSARKEFVQTGYNLVVKINDLAKKNNKTTGNNENTSYFDGIDLAESLPDLMQLITVYNQMDISSMLREVVWRMMNDPDASRKERNNRLKTIKIIGEEFMTMAKQVEQKENDQDRNSFHTQTIAEEIKSKFILAFQLASKL